MRIKWKNRIAAILLIFVMAVGMFPSVAAAESGESKPSKLDLAKSISINTKGSYIVSDANTANTITIESGVTCDLTINNVTITAQDSPAVTVEPGAVLNLIVKGENKLSGGAGFAGICVEPAYDEKGNYNQDGSAKLTISGTDVLTATGGDGYAINKDDKGYNKGETFGGGAGVGGNGETQHPGDACVDFGTIEIDEEFSGTIKATGGDCSGDYDDENTFGGGAGIGSGGFNMADGETYCWGEVYGTIKIHGGDIEATSNSGGAGIGGGSAYGDVHAWIYFSIKITGGNIEATGGDYGLCECGAGIGGGSGCDGGNITISGGNIVAKGGNPEKSMGACGIGGGENGGVFTSLNITGGCVTAVGSAGAAGIGSGSNASFSDLQYGDEDGDRTEGKIGIINISGEDTIVNAYGGSYNGTAAWAPDITIIYGGAGIGSGYPSPNSNNMSVAFDISITDGATVNAYGGSYAQAIGYGYRDDTDSADINDYFTGYGIRLELDDTISLLAVNDDYFQPALVATTTYDDDPIEYSSENRYLVSYVNENRETTVATSDKANGYLNWGQDAESINWSYEDSKLSIAGHEVGAVEDLKGNWAVLYPAFTPAIPPITVSYEWVTTDNPDDVEPPANDMIEAGTEYTAEEQGASMRGYQFDGWYTDKDCIQKYQDGSVLNSNTTLYGKWIKNSVPVPECGSLAVSKTVSGSGASNTKEFPFTVTLNNTKISGSYGDMTFANGVAQFSLKAGESKLASNLPAVVGYTVEESDNVGYTVTVNGTSDTKATGTIAANITSTAAFNNYKPGGDGGHVTPYYTLKYESNGGTEYKDERYAKNTVVDLDKVPSREGYTFTGWYADEALTIQISEIKMTSDKTVYAGWRQSTVPDMLNGSDHFAYVVGYPNGNVGPTDNITRAEVATIFFRLLKADVRDANLTKVNSFSDVPEESWFNTPVSTMEHLGIIKGRAPELFAPEAEITRAEFAAICARFDTSVENGNSNFPDISGHWAETEIQWAATLGWIQGLPDGTFQPDRYITRAEAMTMINRVLCRIPETESDLLSGMRVWPDNQPGAWYYLAVQEATNSHTFEAKGEIYEHWLTLTDDPDWSKYQ